MHDSSRVLAFCVSPLRAQSDTQAPQLVGLSISPLSVDVTLAARQVTFTLQVTDDLSGINFGNGFRPQIYFRSPSRTQLVQANPPDQSGLILNATLTVTMTIPQYAEPGIWTIDYIRLADNAGNFDRLSGVVLAAAGFPVSVDVIDTTPDYEAPRLAAITMSPMSLNVSASDVVVTVNISVTDDASGAERTGSYRESRQVCCKLGRAGC